MAARSLASISISFGLVSIPVKLYSATESTKPISFNLLHKACGSRVKQQYICETEGVVVQREDMTKGYEFTKDQYVTFTPSELKALEEVGSQTADISEFVPVTAVDPLYYDKPYFMAPDKGGAKPYALLTSALRDTGRVALGRWAVRGKQYIVMIRPMGNGLVMQQLLYGREVRSMNDLDIPSGEVKESELNLAKMLIEQQASDTFDPSQFPDTVTERVQAAIDEKVKGKEIVIAEAPRATGQVIDLMAALRASLEQTQAKPARRKAGAAPANEPAAPAELREARKGPKRSHATTSEEPLLTSVPGRKTRKKA